MIGTAHERARLDHAASEAEAELLPARKFLRRDPAIERQVLRGGPEILAEPAIQREPYSTFPATGEACVNLI